MDSAVVLSHVCIQKCFVKNQLHLKENLHLIKPLQLKNYYSYYSYIHYHILVRTSEMQICWCVFSIMNFENMLFCHKFCGSRQAYQAASGESYDTTLMARIHYMTKVLTLIDPVRKYSEDRHFTWSYFHFSPPRRSLLPDSDVQTMMGLEKHRGSKDKREISKPSIERQLLHKTRMYIYHKSILAMTTKCEVLRSQYCWSIWPMETGFF